MPFHVDKFWANASSGASFMSVMVGYHAYVLEFVYQKYLNGCCIVAERYLKHCPMGVLTFWRQNIGQCVTALHGVSCVSA